MALEKNDRLETKIIIIIKKHERNAAFCSLVKVLSMKMNVKIICQQNNGNNYKNYINIKSYEHII